MHASGFNLPPITNKVVPAQQQKPPLSSKSTSKGNSAVVLPQQQPQQHTNIQAKKVRQYFFAHTNISLLAY